MGRSTGTLYFLGLVLLALFVCQILMPQVMVQALWFPVFVVASVLGFRVDARSADKGFL